MISVEEFQPEDIDQMDVQLSQCALLPHAERNVFAHGAWNCGPAWTARDRTGRIIFCGGFLPIHAEHAITWAVLSPDKGAALIAITRRILGLLAGVPWRRVEMFTDPRFPQAGDWAHILGFSIEGVRRAVNPDGSDMICWTRIRSD